MRKTLNTIAGLVLGALIGVTFMWAFAAEPETKYVPVPTRVVPCAAEDSCSIDYRDGAWYIGTEGSGPNNM